MVGMGCEDEDEDEDEDVAVDALFTFRVDSGGLVDRDMFIDEE